MFMSYGYMNVSSENNEIVSWDVAVELATYK